MKPRLRHFTWVVDHESDNDRQDPSTGWLMRGFESLEPSQGFGVAHDALEHHTLKLGMDAELQALGAILYGRWQRKGSSMARSLAYDVVGFLADGSGWCTPVKRFTSIADDEPWVEDMVIKFGADLYEVITQQETDREVPHDRETLPAQIKDACEWMRRGFRKTARVWAPHYGHHAFLSAFDDITRTVERIGTAEEGDRLTVRIDVCGGVQIAHRRADGYEY